MDVMARECPPLFDRRKDKMCQLDET